MDGTSHADTFTHQLARFLPFRDMEACARARAIPRERLTEHPNPQFTIRIIDQPAEFYQRFADDLVTEIRSARDEQRRLVLILPVGPMDQYPYAAEAINRERLSLAHVHTFNMDEYANEDGQTAPSSWTGSFQRAMREEFFGRIDPQLRQPEAQIHFPTSDQLPDYSRRIADLGGADVCYGGIGWSGHIAFWEPHLGAEFDGDLDAYRRAGARTVELHPMTIMQSALKSFGGDWSQVPPNASTIGPREILGAKRRSFWLSGDLGGGQSWQRFIARLCAHGPISEYLPGTLLQEQPGDYTMIGSVADNVQVRIR